MDPMGIAVISAVSVLTIFMCTLSVYRIYESLKQPKLKISRSDNDLRNMIQSDLEAARSSNEYSSETSVGV